MVHNLFSIFKFFLAFRYRMAAKYNMKLVWKKNFHDIFKEYEREHASLLAKMSALEVNFVSCSTCRIEMNI